MFELSFCPIIDFRNEKTHGKEKCHPFPDWTQGETQEYVENKGPWGYGVNRMRYFDDGKTPHPTGCDCPPSPTGLGVRYHGGVCYVANWGTWVSDLDLLGLDWSKQRVLALGTQKPTRAAPLPEHISRPPLYRRAWSALLRALGWGLGV